MLGMSTDLGICVGGRRSVPWTAGGANVRGVTFHPCLRYLAPPALGGQRAIICQSPGWKVIFSVT